MPVPRVTVMFSQIDAVWRTEVRTDVLSTGRPVTVSNGGFCIVLLRS